jgi:hypothetical protein
MQLSNESQFWDIMVAVGQGLAEAVAVGSGFGLDNRFVCRFWCFTPVPWLRCGQNSEQTDRI